MYLFSNIYCSAFLFSVINRNIRLLLFYIFILLPFFLFSSTLLSQTEKGYFPIRNYSPKEYDAMPQNWAILQDKRGVMYFGNNEGILEYDGIHWKLIETPDETNIRALAIDDKGKIYVGGQGEIGYLFPDTTGNMTFFSLLDLIPEHEREFDDIWNIIVLNEKVYFQTHNTIFIFYNNKMKVINFINNQIKINNLFTIGDKVFVQQSNIGLYKVIEDSLILISDLKFFSDKEITFMIPYKSNLLMIGTKEHGIFLMNIPDNNNAFLSYTTFPTSIDKIIANNRIDNALKINDSLYAIGTFGKGVMLMNHEGKTVQFFNKNTGLQDDMVYKQYLDNAGNLWLALSNGISRIDLNDPITSCNENNGLNGTVQSIVRHKGTLYIATLLGVYFLNDNTDNSLKEIAQFTKVKGINIACWNLLSFKTEKDTLLLVVADDGIFQINSNKEAILILKNSTYSLHQSKQDPYRIFIGLEDSLASAYFNNGNWQDEGKVKGVSGTIFKISEDKAGNLWLGTYNKGVIRCNDIVFENHKNTFADVITYNTENNLPEGAVYVTIAKEKPLFATAKGVYVFNKEDEKFYPDSSLQKSFVDGSRYIHRISSDMQSNLWMITIVNEKRYDIGYVNKEKEWINIPFLDISKSIAHAVYHDVNNVTWLGGPEGLYRFDASIQKNYKNDYTTLIRKITIGNDSNIFLGAFYDEEQNIISKQPTLFKPTLFYKYNSIRFEFSAQNEITESPVMFSYILEGFNDEWTDWKEETKAVYTNLPENNYRFRVKAKNIYENESVETVYEFNILAPWYRTVWAYIGYVLSFAGFVYGAITISTRGLQAIIRERTAEIRLQKEEIEEKNRDIMDSIRYAKHIQEAILPTERYVKKYLTNSFILYKPKDIVSGDFYWMESIKNQIIIAAVDCTGHGVPGAFMSIVGHNGLNQAVNQYGLTKPSDILNQLNQSVSETLRQKHRETSVKDGMDIAICCFDFEINKLQFAGAFNPLYIIRKSSTEYLLEEIKANKHPIGSFVDNELKPFYNNEIEIKEGDTIYIFSDGFADQFGGPKGKKFKYTNFKELLISLQTKPMQEQKEILNKTIEDWKGNLEQIDDICVIGVRV